MTIYTVFSVNSIGAILPGSAIGTGIAFFALDTLNALLALVTLVALFSLDTLNALLALVTLVALFTLGTLNALLALVTLVAFFALGTCRSHFSGSFHIERFPILTIVIGNIPEVIITDFELRCSTIDTVCSVCAVLAVCTIRSDSLYACVGFTDPPVAVFANVGRFTVLAFFTILTVGACRLNFRIRKADPPVAVLTDIRSFAVLARLSVVTGRFYAGVGSPDPPVAIATDYCAIIGLNQKDLENQGILA